ncbi:glycosyltransferase family 4 protein [Gelria sp. Kuro-4]|uniref:glycosyltransferase family 4 protein n=1 Tax=Gelria sp. Kuro-4 TaxID=2796927 RepID=UPI001BF04B76|nr:glycosyltransferase family 4 protein [Gelria sp. Kuro-4]BCV25475.1 glycosyl transferase [Gelria sp. Kuro-4]
MVSDRNVGGAGRYLLNLLPGLAAEGMEVAVACPGGGELEAELKRQGWRPLLLSRGDVSFSAAAVREVYGFLAGGRYDVVHTHASLAGRVAARLARVPVLVLTRHGLGGGRPAPAWKRRLNRLAAHALTDAVIAISEAVAAQVQAEGVDVRQIEVVPNGIDVDEFARASGAAVRLELGVGGRPLVGMVARLVPEKAPQDFIRAAALVKRRCPEAAFLLAGSGPAAGELKELASRLGLGSEFHFLGYRRDVAAVTAALDVAVLTSHREGLGLVLLEAMAAAKPVVATAVGGITEVVEPEVTGLLVPPGEPEQVAAAVERLLRDRKRAAQLGRAGQQLAWSRFSRAAMARETAAIYEELLAKRRRGRA